MTDKKLMELAAKAAGYQIHIGQLYNGMESLFIGKPKQVMEDPDPIEWNPLIDDGDALRLAVKLRLHFSAFEGYVSISNFGRGLALIELVNDAGDDGQILVAARKAIVGAAAEIGKDMP